MLRVSVAILVLLFLLPEPIFAQNGLTTIEKQPQEAYVLELNQDDRDRIDELIVELRQLNTRIRKIAETKEPKPIKQRRYRRKR